MHSPDPQLADILNRQSSGHLQIQLAMTPDEVEAAQALRYRIFFEEMGGIPGEEAKRSRRDFDQYDAFCDHLLIVDTNVSPPKVVGTYRLLPGVRALEAGLPLYTESEFDISKLKEAAGAANLLEVGRSCVDPDYRNGRSIQLLWRGIVGYTLFYQSAWLTGCASFPGVDPQKHALALSYLRHFHAAPDDVAPLPLPEFFVPMDAIPASEINEAEAMQQLPPLIKGYAKNGTLFGHGAVIDPLCRTVDVCVLLSLQQVRNSRLCSRYFGDLAAGDASDGMTP